MFEKTLCLFTGFLGLILFLLMAFRLKNNLNVNIYLIIIILLGSVRFLVHGLLTNLPILLSYHKQINYTFAVCVWPLLYLYFKKLAQAKDGFKNKYLLHFVTPISIICVIWFKNYLNIKVYNIALEIGILFSLFTAVIYAIVCYKLLKKNVWSRKSYVLVNNQQNKIITQWTQFLYALIIVLLIKFLLNLAMNNDLLWFKNQNQYIGVGAFIWITIYLKMLSSPEIIYGYQEFQNKISEYKKSTIVFDYVWIPTDKEVLNIQDVALKNKISGSIQHYIIEIERLAIISDLFLFENFKIVDLANKLSVPQSHILYLFKYHSTISFVDLKKIIRIQKAIILIEEGFLKTNTLEALAAHTGFSSYSSFFKSFKSIVGSSPKEFIKN